MPPVPKIWALLYVDRRLQRKGQHSWLSLCSHLPLPGHLQISPEPHVSCSDVPQGCLSFRVSRSYCPWIRAPQLIHSGVRLGWLPFLTPISQSANQVYCFYLPALVSHCLGSSPHHLPPGVVPWAPNRPYLQSLPTRTLPPVAARGIQSNV